MQIFDKIRALAQKISAYNRNYDSRENFELLKFLFEKNDVLLIISIFDKNFNVIFLNNFVFFSDTILF